MFYFNLGIEAPFNSECCVLVGEQELNYGDIAELVVYLTDSGSTVVNSTLALRAQVEYIKLYDELMKSDTNYSLASFYAGAMSHYISQAGVFGAIWYENDWGSLDVTNWSFYELAIEAGLKEQRFIFPQAISQFIDLIDFGNNYFNLTPNQIEPLKAFNSTINLATVIYPFAQFLGNNINLSLSNVLDWDGLYYNITRDCLTFSIEAVYSTLEFVMKSANLNYLSIDEVNFSFDIESGLLNITPFQVELRTNTTNKVANDSIIIEANFQFIFYDTETRLYEISTESNSLNFNDSLNKWFFSNQIPIGLRDYSNHSIICQFKTELTSYTWSNLSSDSFYLNYYNITIEGFNLNLDENNWLMSISNITATLNNNEEIGKLDDEEVSLAKWILYYKSQFSESSILTPVHDTEGNIVEANLSYDDLTTKWYSSINDIGLVFTPPDYECVVAVRFNMTILPVGEYVNTPFGYRYHPYVQKINTNYFITKSHDITISVPTIDFDEEWNILDLFDVTATQDYQNLDLDNYHMNVKSVFGDDRREAKWKIFNADGIETIISGLLIWDSNQNYWYYNNINLDLLGQGIYYVRCKFTTMNTAFDIDYGPPSVNFTVNPSRTSNWYFYLIILVPFVIYGLHLAANRKTKLDY